MLAGFDKGVFGDTIGKPLSAGEPAKLFYALKFEFLLFLLTLLKISQVYSVK